jgi:hypothetical protein
MRSREVGLAAYVARVGEKRNAYRVLDGKPEGKRLPSIPGRRWNVTVRTKFILRS